MVLDGWVILGNNAEESIMWEMSSMMSVNGKVSVAANLAVPLLSCTLVMF